MVKENGNTAEPELLGKADILGAQDRAFEVVEVPEWGGKVRVKGLNGDERDAYEALILQERKDGSYKARLTGARAKLLALTIVDAKGSTIFGMGDIQGLGKKSAAASQRVWKVAAKLAGITEEDLEELTRDLEPAPSDGLTSVGPSPQG